MFNSLKFWRRRKYKVAETDVIILDASNMPKEIRAIAIEIVDEILIEYISENDELKNLGRIYVYYNDNFTLPSNIEDWFGHFFLIKDRLIKDIWTKTNTTGLKLASIDSHKYIDTNIVDLVVVLDVLFYDYLFKIWWRHSTDFIPLNRDQLTAADILLPHDTVKRAIPTVYRVLRASKRVIGLVLSRTLNHEVDHLILSIRNKGLFLARRKAISRIHDLEVNTKHAIDEGENIDYDLSKVYFYTRKMLEAFSFGLLYEGLAMYAEKSRPRTNKGWIGFYDGALKDAEELKTICGSINVDSTSSGSAQRNIRRAMVLKIDELGVLLKKFMYPIGVHMVYTISFFPINVYSLNRRQFFELYEQVCVEKFKSRPLVTYGSGHGVVDIKRIIIELKSAYKKLR